jgi:hypothetical protein
MLLRRKTSPNESATIDLIFSVSSKKGLQVTNDIQ